MTRLRYALTGLLAAVAGIAAGHLVAAFTTPAASPVLAIGSTVIDLTPQPLKEWAIEHFGTNDKVVLQASVLVGTLVLSALVGPLARRRLWLSLAGLAVLVGLAGAAAVARPTGGILDAVPSAVAFGVGAVVLVGHVRAI